MAESLKPEWRVLTTEDGHVIYHNDITGEETRESPYLAQLNKYRNCDITIWQKRREECVKFAKVHPRPRVNLDINFGDRIGGRITVELFADVAPLTAYNFYCLCTGEFPPIDGQELKLKGSFFYSCTPNVGMMGGDISKGDGTGGMSIYGAPFEDENLNKVLDRAGFLVSLNDGINLNLSRFLITSAPTPSLMSTHSLFGRVVRGLAVVRNAMALPANAEGRTEPLVVIANTSVAPDGPIPDDFTIPRELSYRPNPMVPPACESLLGSNKAIGLAHKYTQQTQQQYDLPAGETPDETPGVAQDDTQDTQAAQAAPTYPTNETPFANETPAGEEDGVETAPGVDPVPEEAPIDYDLQAAQAAQAYSYYYGGVSQYDESYAMSMASGAMGTLDTLGTVGAAGTAGTGSATGAGGNTGNAEAPPGEEEEAFAAPRSFISNVMDDSRRGNMPRDADGRALAHYLDLSTLDSHTAKKKKNKIPKGFKTWKEYGEFKKKEKRARQVHDILEDKYPVEYLEKRRHHCVVC